MDFAQNTKILPIKMKRKFICTKHQHDNKPYCRWGNLDEKSWIDGETPIEDFGMFILLDEEISTESADRLFMAFICHNEGEEPEVSDNPKDFEILARPVLAPPLLTSKEKVIFDKLLSEE